MMSERRPDRDDLRSLKAVNSLVSARDMEIWENVAHSIHREKEIETFKNEIALNKEHIAKAKEQIEMFNSIAQNVGKSVQIENPIIAQLSHKLYFEEFERDLRKKHADAIQQYEKFYQYQRSEYENRSISYQELKKKQAELKRLKVEKMNLDVAVANRERAIQQYREITEKRWQQAVVKFADFYITYHKYIKVSKDLETLKKQEKSLIEENIRLTEEAKNFKRMQQLNLTSSFIQTTKEPPITPTQSKAPPNLEEYQILKFLDEDASLTPTPPPEPTQISNFNKDNTKVQILNVRTLPPVPLILAPVTQPDPEFVKKITAIATAVSEEAKNTKSLRVVRFEPLSSQEGRKNTSLNTSQLSQSSNCSQKRKRKEDVDMPKLFKEPAAQKPEVPKCVAKETSSILKQANDRKEETQSKYFRKTVTFNNEVKSQEKFQLFNVQEKLEPTTVAFRQPLFFGESSFLKGSDKSELQENQEMEGDNANVSFTMDTEPTGTGTSEYEKSLIDLHTDESSFVKSFDTGFFNNKNEPENVQETSIFNFGSQSRNNNLFDF